MKLMGLRIILYEINPVGNTYTCQRFFFSVFRWMTATSYVLAQMPWISFNTVNRAPDKVQIKSLGQCGVESDMVKPCSSSCGESVMVRPIDHALLMGLQVVRFCDDTSGK